MIRSIRFRRLLLALLVTVSHMALVSHVAAHFQPSLDHCELCVSQAHPLAAIPMAEAVPSAVCRPAAGLPPAEPLSLIPATEHTHQPRGPPVASS
jgi:hypothetical protein